MKHTEFYYKITGYIYDLRIKLALFILNKKSVIIGIKFVNGIKFEKSNNLLLANNIMDCNNSNTQIVLRTIK